MHEPVMAREVADVLVQQEGGVYVDASFGAGGFSRAVLERGAGRVVAFDKDVAAVERGESMVKEFSGKLSVCYGSFSSLTDILSQEGMSKVDGIMFDAGLSSDQLEEAERGFSFRRSGGLDMRFDRQGRDAKYYIHRLREETLARVLAVYGEERRARAVARAIVAAVKRGEMENTLDLARVVASATGGGKGLHPATRTFQALRMLVNDELGELAQGLMESVRALKEGGRLVVVVFHSLEDRVVKRFFRDVGGVENSLMQGLFKTPLRPTAEEVRKNPRSRSAKLRAGVRTGCDVGSMSLPWVPTAKRVLAGAV